MVLFAGIYGNCYLLLSLRIKRISFLYRPLTSLHTLFALPCPSCNLTFSSAVLRRLSLTVPADICRCCNALRSRNNPVAFNISHSTVFVSTYTIFHWSLVFIIIFKEMQLCNYFVFLVKGVLLQCDHIAAVKEYHEQQVSMCFCNVSCAATTVKQ